MGAAPVFEAAEVVLNLMVLAADDRFVRDRGFFI